MALRFDFIGDYGVHVSQGVRTEEYFTALGTDIGRHITENEHFALPSVNVFYLAWLYMAFTERTLGNDDTSRGRQSAACTGSMFMSMLGRTPRR